MSKKVIEINDGGFVWHVPADAIAKNRAYYYAQREDHDVYQEEYDYTLGDNSELIDWFMNNMDWEDVEEVATLVKTPPQPKKPELNDEWTVIEVKTV